MELNKYMLVPAHNLLTKKITKHSVYRIYALDLQPHITFTVVYCMPYHIPHSLSYKMLLLSSIEWRWSKRYKYSRKHSTSMSLMIDKHNSFLGCEGVVICKKHQVIIHKAQFTCQTTSPCYWFITQKDIISSHMPHERILYNTADLVSCYKVESSMHIKS